MADDHSGDGMGTGMIVGLLVIVLIVFFLFFGRGFMGAGGGNAEPAPQQSQTDVESPEGGIDIPDQVDVNIDTPQ